MSKSVMISMLAECDNGTEILSILDYLTEDNQQSIAYAEPTAAVIDF